MHILVVEDERRMGELLKRALAEEGHQVELAQDGRQGLELARLPDLDLLVLDLMLPSIDGFTIARRLRAEGNRIPILVLTARDSNDDIVRALDMGADDYLTKPFSFDVFLARVRAVSRRGPIASPVVYRCADLLINTMTREVKRGSRTIDLTSREYCLLELLARRSPRILSREAIIEALWGFNAEVSANNVEAFVHLLRAKLDLPGEPRLLHTIRGAGYTLREGDRE